MCSKALCWESVQNIAEGSPYGIVVDSENVYWTDAMKGVLACPLAGCSGSPRLVAPAQEATNLVVDATSVYWTDGLQVYRCPLAGCTTPIVMATVPSTAYSAMAVNATSLFWTDVHDVHSCSLPRLRSPGDDRDHDGDGDARNRHDEPLLVDGPRRAHRVAAR